MGWNGDGGNPLSDGWSRWAMPATAGYDSSGYNHIQAWSDHQVYAYMANQTGHTENVRKILAWYETTGVFTEAQRHYLNNHVYMEFF